MFCSCPVNVLLMSRECSGRVSCITARESDRRVYGGLLQGQMVADNFQKRTLPKVIFSRTGVLPKSKTVMSVFKVCPPPFDPKELPGGVPHPVSCLYRTLSYAYPRAMSQAYSVSCTALRVLSCSRELVHRFYMGASTSTDNPLYWRSCFFENQRGYPC